MRRGEPSSPYYLLRFPLSMRMPYSLQAFETEDDLADHFAQSPEHVYCEPCKLLFPSQDALNQHERHVHHFCNQCFRYFPSALGLKEHFVQSGSHAYCQHCDLHFPSRRDLPGHYTAAHHWCRCNSCKQVRTYPSRVLTTPLMHRS